MATNPYPLKDSFVYVWTDHAKCMLYVGVHKGRVDDGYVCSSKYMKPEYYCRPSDFTRQIVAEGLYEDMRRLEVAILKSINAKKDPHFYNRTNGEGDFYNPGGHTFTEETRSLMSKKKIGNTNASGQRTEESKRRMSISSARKGNPGTFKDKRHSEESKRKMSDFAKSDPNRTITASKGGKAAALMRRSDPKYFEEYKKRQSDQMKRVWEERKKSKN